MGSLFLSLGSSWTMRFPLGAGVDAPPPTFQSGLLHCRNRTNHGQQESDERMIARCSRSLGVVPRQASVKVGTLSLHFLEGAETRHGPPVARLLSSGNGHPSELVKKQVEECVESERERERERRFPEPA
jgi:hypothetical protein